MFSTLDLASILLLYAITSSWIMKDIIGKQTMRWTETWLNCHSKSLVISDRKSIWVPATYRVPQGSVLSQCCLTISLMSWRTGQSAPSGIKLGENVNTPDGCAAIQRDLSRQKKWAIDLRR